MFVLTNETYVGPHYHTSCDGLYRTTEALFLSAAAEYSDDAFRHIPHGLKYVIIFIPYHKHYLQLRAFAKLLRNKFAGITVYIVDTNETRKTSVNCGYSYNELPSTTILAIDYLIRQHPDKDIFVGKVHVNEKETKYFNQLLNSKAVKSIDGMGRNRTEELTATPSKGVV